MVVWCIPGDDVGVLHASALFVERKFPDASQQPDEAHGKASAQVKNMVKNMCVADVVFATWSLLKSHIFFGPWLFSTEAADFEPGSCAINSRSFGQRSPLTRRCCRRLQTKPGFDYLTYATLGPVFLMFFGSKVFSIVDVVEMILLS